MADIIVSKLFQKDWKSKLTASPSYARCIPISLYDAMFYKDDSGLTNLRVSTSANSLIVNEGIKLEHDIIYYSTDLYNQLTGAFAVEQFTPELFNKWLINGFDISKAYYDQREVPFYAENFIINCKSNDINDNEIEIHFDASIKSIYNKRSNLKESSTQKTECHTVKAVRNYYDGYSFIKNSYSWSSSVNDSLINAFFPRSQNEEDARIFDPNTQSDFLSFFSFPSASYTDENSFEGTPDIILSNEDTIFSNYIAQATSAKALNKIAFSSSTYMKNIFDSVLKLRSAKENEGDLVQSIHEIDPINFFKGIADTINKGDANAKILEFILKHNFICLRCSFFADYIDPKDFNQSLTRDSNVVFKNLHVKSGASNFSRYNDLYSDKDVENEDKESLSKETNTYIPQTYPIIDLASKDIYENAAKKSVAVDIKDTIADLIEVGDSLDTQIGSLFSEGYDTSTADVYSELKEDDSYKDKAKSLYPQGYFDTESLNNIDDYESYKRLPVLLSPEGNIITDGRIISVTIDEIYQTLLKILFGRNDDESSKDKGIPFGNKSKIRNAKDTRLFEVETSEITLRDVDGNEHTGMPLSSKVITTEENNVERQERLVDYFINRNDSIKYTIYDMLQTLGDKIVSQKKTFEDATHLSDRYKIETQLPLISVIDDVANTNVIDDGLHVLQDTPQETGDWAPRSIPMSIAELEAAMKQNKYNLITLARFLKMNFAVNGPLGKSYKGPTLGTELNRGEILSEGSLFQLHKDYNNEVDNPNTYFNIENENCGPSQANGFGAKFSDGNRDNTIDAVSMQASDRYFHDNYGKSIITSQVNGYDPKDVYLGADGQWHSVTEHSRVPVLRCKY